MLNWLEKKRTEKRKEYLKKKEKKEASLTVTFTRNYDHKVLNSCRCRRCRSLKDYMMELGLVA
jgi:hypothetical protein